jgi:hypothetical protein
MLAHFNLMRLLQLAGSGKDGSVLCTLGFPSGGKHLPPFLRWLSGQVTMMPKCILWHCHWSLLQKHLHISALTLHGCWQGSSVYTRVQICFDVSNLGKASALVSCDESESL